MRKLLLYIETDRNGYDDANTHDFIFVSAKKTPGQPLAKTSVQSIFDRLSQALDFHIHPHLFRHKWQEVFEVQAKKQGYTDEQINDMRKTACGWSESSDMVRVYNEFRNAVLVQEMSKIRQSEFMPKIDHSSKERVNEE
ncbi:MAG: site-specific integrase [Alteromonadaceae bacterium TMED7]|nr:MAG: site-specific integrase [Alteromonadaceae bacterium TMED7]